MFVVMNYSRPIYKPFLAWLILRMPYATLTQQYWVALSGKMTAFACNFWSFFRLRMNHPSVFKVKTKPFNSTFKFGCHVSLCSGTIRTLSLGSSLQRQQSHFILNVDEFQSDYLQIQDVIPIIYILVNVISYCTLALPGNCPIKEMFDLISFTLNNIFGSSFKLNIFLYASGFVCDFPLLSFIRSPQLIRWLSYFFQDKTRKHVTMSFFPIFSTVCDIHLVALTFIYDISKMFKKQTIIS